MEGTFARTRPQTRMRLQTNVEPGRHRIFPCSITLVPASSKERNRSSTCYTSNGEGSLDSISFTGGFHVLFLRILHRNRPLRRGPRRQHAKGKEAAGQAQSPRQIPPLVGFACKTKRNGVAFQNSPDAGKIAWLYLSVSACLCGGSLLWEEREQWQARAPSTSSGR